MGYQMSTKFFKWIKLFVAIVVCAGTFATAPTIASASSNAVTVNVNMARILRINSPASTVIIGNPAIADVTIQDAQTLVLTGKNFGTTNLIILDAVGNPVADTLVDVVQQDADLLTIYAGNARSTMSCQPVCQPTATLGDDPEYTAQSLASSSLIEEAASND